MSDNGNAVEGISKNERGELVLDITALRPKPRWLTIPQEDGDPISVKIPGNLPLDTMLELQAIEERISDSSATDESTLAELRGFAELVQKIIADHNPEAGDLDLELGYMEATRLLIFLAQPNDSMAQAFVEAITAGGGEKPDAASKDAHALAVAAGLEAPPEEGETEAPLPSRKRSSKSSSRSASSTTGRRSGGSGRASRGKRSASTSRTRSKDSANAKPTG